MTPLTRRSDRGEITGRRVARTDKNGCYEIRRLFDGVEEVKGDSRFDIQIVKR